MKQLLNRLKRDQDGATAVEYGLIVALIVIAAISGMQIFADQANAIWDFVELRVAT